VVSKALFKVLDEFSKKVFSSKNVKNVHYTYGLKTW